jgi:hypothetical protein
MPNTPLYSSTEAKQLILSKQQDKRWRQIEITTTFVIWRERCRRVFAEQEKDIISISREIMTEYNDWFN